MGEYTIYEYDKLGLLQQVFRFKAHSISATKRKVSKKYYSINNLIEIYYTGKLIEHKPLNQVKFKKI